jgi:hypothetical protein
MEELSSTAVHEYFEAATDPLPDSNPAFTDVADADWVWGAPYGGELSDLCVTADDYADIRPADLGFPVPRQWSNARAAAGKPPCLPDVADRPYFVAIPETSSAIKVTAAAWTGYSGTLNSKGILLGRGATVVVPLTLAAAPLTGAAWELSIEDWNTDSGFTYAFSATSVHVGDHPTLAVTGPAAATYSVALVKATLAGTSGLSAVTNVWPVLVSTTTK